MTIRLIICLSVALLLPTRISQLVGQTHPDSPDMLTLGKPIERALSGDQGHSYRIALRAGQFLRVIIDQRGIDVVVTLSAPDGKDLVEVDSPNGSQGPEPISFEALVSGKYGLQVRSLDKSAPAGRYEVKIEQLRPATAQDRLRIGAERALGQANQLLQQGTAESRQLAMTKYQESLRYFRLAGDRVDEAMTLGNIGQLFDGIGHRDSALAYYHRAFPILHAVGERAREAGMLNRIGNLFADAGPADSAIAYYRQALPIRHFVGDRSGEAGILNNIGLVFTQIGEPDSALAYYRQALSIRRAAGDRSGEAIALNSIGYQFAGINRPDSALSYYRQALPIQRAIGDRTGEAKTLNYMGVVFERSDQPDSALSYHHQALPIRRAAGDRTGEAATLNNLGVVFDGIGRPDSALAYYRQALPITHSLGDRTVEENLLTNMGIEFTRTGQPDSALAYYRQALPIQRAVGDRAVEAATLANIGGTFGGIGRQDSALAYYRQALPITHAVGDRRGEANTLNNMGAAFRGLGQLDSALAYSHQVLPMRRAVGDRRGEAVTLGNIGRIFHDINRLDSAVVYYDRSIALITAISTRTGSDFNQLSFNETTTKPYALWTLAWLARAPQVGSGQAAESQMDSASAAYGALATSERGRGRALLDLLRDSTVHVEPGADFPAEGARLAALVRRSKSAGLVYFSTGDTLITWLISSREKLSVFRRAMDRDTLAALIGQFRAGLGAEDGSARSGLRGALLETEGDRGSGMGSVGAWQRRTEVLATILLPPEVLRLLAAEREVVIVPQGALALVPFAALPIGRAGEPFGSKLAVRYAPSLATLGHVEARPGLPLGSARAASLKFALVVGNPTMPEVTVSSGGRNRLASLPGAEAESRDVAAQLGTQPLTGAAATEAEVVRRLPSATMVHLATHGFAYSTEAKARSTFVALAPDSLHDGLLSVGKILDTAELKLTADLVVLSACQTGLGNLKEAEGTVGLQRAFLAKGARSVLVSLWSVSDAATARLMSSFYTHWLNDPDGPSKAEALRRAQNDVRATPGWEHPRFWAAFQLSGAR